MALRSAPAQNDRSPAPVITTTRISGSVSASCSALPSSVLTSPLTALRASGRSRVTRVGSYGSAETAIDRRQDAADAGTVYVDRNGNGVQDGDERVVLVALPRAVL